MEQRVTIDANHSAPYEEVYQLGRQVQKTFAITTGLMGAGAIFMIIDALLVWKDSTTSEKTTMLILALVFFVICVLFLRSSQKKHALRIGITIMRQRFAHLSTISEESEEQAFFIDEGHDLTLFVNPEKGEWRYLMNETMSEVYLLEEIAKVAVQTSGNVVYDRNHLLEYAFPEGALLEVLLDLRNGKHFVFNATDSVALQAFLQSLEQKTSQET